MIDVAILTTWGPGCGTSEHARHIFDHAVDPDVRLHIVTKTIGEFASYPHKHYDIVHVNESGWILQGLKQDTVQRIKASGSKTVLTMCNPIPQNNKNPWTSQFDRVVHFEPHTDDGFEYVPIGAPVFEPYGKPREKYIGTNGFPQARKNLLNLAAACEELGYKLLSFMPRSQHADADSVALQIQGINPGAITRVDWVSDTEMLDYLSICTATCYPYIEWLAGSSSAAMAGVSARVPLVVSRCTQFDFLFNHEDEVYFIESVRPTKDDIVAGLKKMLDDPKQKHPLKLYLKHNWNTVGQRYVEIYKGLMS